MMAQSLSVDSTTTGSQKAFTVYVEGNIGCGKSTFLERCAQYEWIETFPEAVEQWTNVAGVNLLEKFYTDPGA